MPINNGADCGSEQELLLKKSDILKKDGNTIRPFRYDLNQIPFDYMVEVMDRFKGLNLVDRVPEELWMKIRNIVQEAVTKPIPKENKARRQSGCLRRFYK